MRTDAIDENGFNYYEYGIRVTSNSEGIEKAVLELKGLFVSHLNAEELIDLLVRNDVSLLHLFDVIEDYLN